jgi:hypothetical protein
LRDLRTNPIEEPDRIPLTLDIPLLLALVQSKAHRIFREHIFCPFEDCNINIGSIPMISNHIHAKHNINYKKCADIIQFFFDKMFRKGLKTTLVSTNENGEEETVQSDESLERCYLPHCTTLLSSHKYLLSHIKNHAHLELKTNTDSLGWFWGIIRLNILNNPFLTIKDILKNCEAFQCQSEKCHKHVLATEQGLRNHFPTQ